MTKFFKVPHNIQLESGQSLQQPRIAYHTYGQPNADASNIIWVCHALTANSDVFDWWKGLFGPDSLFNPEDHYIICANMLGSHYGTEGPLAEAPGTGLPYFHSFPEISIRDMVKLHQELAKHLKIKQIKLLIGGSMGGQQSLEWAIVEPNRFEHLALIATNALHSPWGVAFNASQRMAIANDATWTESHPDAGKKGMEVARSIALLSYRNATAYNKTQQATNPDEIYPDRAGSYQQYQGRKLAARFNAFSYWHLSKAMDSHNVGRGRGGVEQALSLVQAKTLVVTIEDDVLFPPKDQQRLINGIAHAKAAFIPSDFGHDGFLLETKGLSKLLSDFLQLKKEEPEKKKSALQNR